MGELLKNAIKGKDFDFFSCIKSNMCRVSFLATETCSFPDKNAATREDRQKSEDLGPSLAAVKNSLVPPVERFGEG
jgi:hypothetical protein